MIIKGQFWVFSLSNSLLTADCLPQVSMGEGCGRLKSKILSETSMDLIIIDPGERSILSMVCRESRPNEEGLGARLGNSIFSIERLVGLFLALSRAAAAIGVSLPLSTCNNLSDPPLLHLEGLCMFQ